MRLLVSLALLTFLTGGIHTIIPALMSEAVQQHQLSKLEARLKTMEKKRDTK